MGKPIYIDRSRVETRQACPRQRFWTYDFAGTGVVRSSNSLPLLNGVTIHAAHARLFLGMGIEAVIGLAESEYKAELDTKGVFGEVDVKALYREQMALLEGMIRLWAKWRLPVILEEYELAEFCGKPAVELAWDWQMAEGLAQHLRMDAILRRRSDGLLHILDYKSAGYVSEGWRDKFEHCLQTQLYVQALKEKTGEPVGGMLYEGLIKGQYKKDTAKSSPWYGQKVQASPYVYAYLLGDGKSEQSVWSPNYTALKGFRKVRVTDYMPTSVWVEKHLQYLVSPAEMFVVVPPICPPPMELERMKKQVVQQEQRYLRELENYQTVADVGGTEDVLGAMLDNFAPQVPSQCVRYGQDYKCQFLSGICWTQGASPLEDGGFEVRQPHHAAQEV